MDNYLVYFSLALATVLLPGPAVILTINNAIQRGLVKAFSGILGISSAILIIAIISATSLGVILAQSIVVFTIVKFVGAAYLIYLGLKMFLAKSPGQLSISVSEKGGWACFTEGFLVSMSNPKAIVFFMSIFPQFIDVSRDYVPQFGLLAFTFSALVLFVHSAYAFFASMARSRLSSRRGAGMLNKVSGGIFVSFGLGLAASSK